MPNNKDKREECEICGILFKDHSKCKGCHILVGRGHLETSLNKNGECGQCSWLLSTGRFKNLYELDAGKRAIVVPGKPTLEELFERITAMRSSRASI